MKVMMMIKALILIHLWSIFVAGCAWFLQRDGDGRVGASFPASGIWLIMIALSFLPGFLNMMPWGATISVPELEAFDLFPSQVSDNPADGSGTVNFLALYIGFSIFLMGRTLWRWSRLQSLPLLPTAEADIFTTTAEVPPLTLSWPRRAVVVPAELQDQSSLIRHERAHLRHYDAELTLFLLLLQDMMLRGPGVCYLVRQWRLSIELRADYAATNKLTSSERKDYASLLLEGLRSSGDRTDVRDLPCPTAHLTSTRHRGVKMRLTEIVERESKPRTRRWSLALLLTALGASAVGLTSTAASAKEEIRNTAADNIVYVKKVAAQLPASCPGLTMDKADIVKKNIITDGETLQQYAAKIGIVVVHHDVRRDGRIHNMNITYSTHPCFEAGAKASVAQWIAEQQDQEIRDAAVKVDFVVTGDTVKDLNIQFESLVQ